MKPPETGQYEKIVSTSRHHCRLPGFWARLRDGIDVGSIYRCDCGKRYELTVYPMDGPRWRLLENGADHLAACNPTRA